jgi:hypothetical protein
VERECGVVVVVRRELHVSYGGELSSTLRIAGISAGQCAQERDI